MARSRTDRRRADRRRRPGRPFRADHDAARCPRPACGRRGERRCGGGGAGRAPRSRAGAAGFLLKDTPPDELVVAIRYAAQGRPVLSPEVTRRLIARVAESEKDTRRDAARRQLDLDNRVQVALLVHEAGLDRPV